MRSVCRFALPPCLVFKHAHTHTHTPLVTSVSTIAISSCLAWKHSATIDTILGALSGWRPRRVATNGWSLRAMSHAGLVCLGYIVSEKIHSCRNHSIEPTQYLTCLPPCLYLIHALRVSSLSLRNVQHLLTSCMEATAMDTSTGAFEQ
jgi:hypothetical protein